MIADFKKILETRDEARVLDYIRTHPEDLNILDDQGVSGFMHLAYHGYAEAFKEAIAWKKNFTFYEAIMAGKSSLVSDFLVANPELLNAYSPDGFSPVALAAYFNQPEIAGTLLEKGANPNLAASNPSKVNALHAAVARENLDLCNRLFDFGADVNQAQVQGVTPLHSAVHRGNMEMTKLLLDKGARKDLKMDNGDTPQDIAQREGHSELLDLLSE